MNAKILVIIFILSSIATETVARLRTTVYNPGKEGIFPTTSTLLTNENLSILFDAQFSTKDGAEVAGMVKNSGTNLELIVISCGDPDFYFGLQSIVESYPNVKIVASAEVVNHIRSTKDQKLAFWSPQLKDGAPIKVLVPEILNNPQVTLLGAEIIHLQRLDDYAAYYWNPTEKLIVGGVGVSWGIHVFTADTQTPKIRAAWRDVLREMIDLHPVMVIPGHYLGEVPADDKALRFTLEYLEVFEKVLEENNYKNSTAVISAMKQRYPSLGAEASLELSGKVNTGEVKW